MTRAEERRKVLRERAAAGKRSCLCLHRRASHAYYGLRDPSPRSARDNIILPAPFPRNCLVYGCKCENFILLQPVLP